MTSWHFGINSRPECMAGQLWLYDGPAWILLVDWFVLNIVHLPTWILAYIPLPNICPRKRNVPYDNKEYTCRDWYGTLGDLYWVFVFDPCFKWVWEKKQQHQTCIEVGYKKLQQHLGEKHADFFKREAEDSKDDEDA